MVRRLLSLIWQELTRCYGQGDILTLWLIASLSQPKMLFYDTIQSWSNMFNNSGCRSAHPNYWGLGIQWHHHHAAPQKGSSKIHQASNIPTRYWKWLNLLQLEFYQLVIVQQQKIRNVCSFIYLQYYWQYRYRIFSWAMVSDKSDMLCTWII